MPTSGSKVHTIIHDPAQDPNPLCMLSFVLSSVQGSSCLTLLVNPQHVETFLLHAAKLKPLTAKRHLAALRVTGRKMHVPFPSSPNTWGHDRVAACPPPRRRSYMHAPPPTTS